MGFVHEQDGEARHEGYAVGLVPREWSPRKTSSKRVASILDPNPRPLANLKRYSSAGVLRELGMLRADHEFAVRGVSVMQAGCSCGWRSPFWELARALDWTPCTLLTNEHQGGKVDRLWRQHVELELQRGEQLRLGAVAL
jgi:hypothetical protein